MNLQSLTVKLSEWGMFLFSSIQTNNERLTKKVFLHDYDQNSNNSWSNDVENILDTVNLLTHYENKSVCNISKLESNVKILNQNVWYEHIHCLPKLQTYILFKSEYCTENYLKLYLSRSQRSLLAQLRTGILPLRIETGRYQNILDKNTVKFRKMKSNERLCTLCKENYVEDEIHFVCVCKIYDLHRKKLYDYINLLTPGARNFLYFIHYK